MKSTKMNAIVATAYGSPKFLKFAEVAKPEPKENEVLIKVHVSSATTADIMMLSGKPYLGRLFIGLTKPRNPIPGTGFAGTVEAIGASVTNFKVGDEVFGESLFKFSSNAEYITIAEEGLILPLPLSLSMSEAASFCDGPLTSINFLKEIAQIKTGQKILINGASGSLGTAAVQLAKYYGAEVTGVCSNRNAGLVKSLGADFVIDYQQEDFTQSRKQYDIIYDTIGKSSFSKCKPVLREEGMYMTPILSFRVLLQMIRTSIIGKKKVKFDATGAKAQDKLKVLLDDLVELFNGGHLKPVIDRQFPLEKLAQAHEYISTGRKRGNVVIAVNS